MGFFPLPGDDFVKNKYPGYNIVTEDTLEEIVPLVDEYQSIWLVNLAHPQSEDPDQLLVEWFDNNWGYNLHYIFPENNQFFGAVTLTRYVK